MRERPSHVKMVVIIINKNMPKRKIPSLSIEEKGQRWFGVKKQKGFQSLRGTPKT